jgi:tetratricopeptide (TPR) repeat protein
MVRLFRLLLWAALIAGSTVAGPQATAQSNRAKEAADLIIRLCIAGGSDVEIRSKGNSIELSGKDSSVSIDRRESSGLVGGISKEITNLSAQQASEARACTQRYLKDLLDLILKDEAARKRENIDSPLDGGSRDARRRGDEALRLRDPDRAIAEYNEAIRLNLKDASAFNGRGLAYSDKGERDRAIESYSEAIRLNDKVAVFYYNRGYEFSSKRDYYRAIENYSDAIRLNSKDADYFDARGDAYHHMGKYEFAIKDYDEALRINPKHPYAARSRANSEYESKVFELKVCGTRAKASVSFALVSRVLYSEDWVLKGFWTIAPGECLVMGKYPRSKNIYWYAYDTNGKWSNQTAKTTNLCISTARITNRIAKAGYQCVPPEQLERFYEFTVNSERVQTLSF